MDLTNESYTIIFHIAGRDATERYFRAPRRRDAPRPWVKVSTRGNEFRATAEQVLNHLLPALAGVQPRITVEVQHHSKQRPLTPAAGLPTGDVAPLANSSEHRLRRDG